MGRVFKRALFSVSLSASCHLVTRRRLTRFFSGKRLWGKVCCENDSLAPVSFSFSRTVFIEGSLAKGVPRGSPGISWPPELQNSTAENSCKGSLGTVGKATSYPRSSFLPLSLPLLTSLYCCGSQLSPPHLLHLSQLTILA